MSSGFGGQEVDRGWESPWNWSSSLLLTRASRGSRQQKDQGINYKSIVADTEHWPPKQLGHSVSSLIWGPYLTTVTEVTLVTPVLKSSDSSWGVAQSWSTPQVHSWLCPSSQHCGVGARSIQSRESPWRLFIPGHVLSSRISKTVWRMTCPA